MKACSLRRDLEFEREITRQAAKGLVDPERLIVHSETRCIELSGEYTPDPMQMAPDRDFLRDALEECADLKSYLVFWLQTHVNDRGQDGDVDERRRNVFLALRHTTLLYDLLSEND